MKKRIVSLILTVITLIGILPIIPVNAAITPGKPTYGSASGYGTGFTLTGDQAKDIVAVAKAQVSKGKAALGYTDNWCDAFVVDCARIANIPTSVIPNARGCKALYDAIIKKGGQRVTTPQAGDIVLYNCTVCEKNYPHISIYAGNGVTYEGNISTPSSVKKFDGKNAYYSDVAGHTYKNKLTLIYVRPKYTTATYHTLKFDANGGTGSMDSISLTFSSDFKFPANSFKYPGYTFKGWNAKRSDGRWYCSGIGWKTDAEIAENNYTKALYNNTTASYTFNDSWTKGTSGAISVTFYAQWDVADYPVNFYYNHSGKNYFRNTDFKTLDTSLYASRDTSVYTVSVDKGRTSEYGSMKIVGKSVGASGKDLKWITSTMGNNPTDGYIGDNKTLTLSFWAKSSVADAKLYLRYGYQSTFKNVALTTDWKYYTLSFNKTSNEGSNFHPYFDKAGTFYISELQLEDGSSATAFTPENGGYETKTYTAFKTYSPLPAPARNGYKFNGWYTSASGGERVTDTTTVKNGKFNLYAHWSKTDQHSHSYTSKVAVIPTDEPGRRDFVCECGNKYSTILDPIVARCDGYISCPSENFTDISSGAWYHLYIDNAVSKGYMYGTSSVKFEPNTNMSRAMLVTVLWRISGEPTPSRNSFTDVKKGMWYSDAVSWAAANNIVSGVGNNRFDPNTNITREQLASILYRYCSFKGIETSGKSSLESFNDSAKASAWAREALEWVVNEGLLVGSGGDLTPKGNATRAQVAIVLTRLCGYIL